jgi:hypothetical protein
LIAPSVFSIVYYLQLALLLIVPNVASFSGLSIFDCPLGFLSLSFIHESTNVALESTHIYITIDTEQQQNVGHHSMQK